MPQTNTSPLERALRAARTPRHTDADVDAVLAAFGEYTEAPPDGGASTLLDVARELTLDGAEPTFGAIGARLSERAAGYRRGAR